MIKTAKKRAPGFDVRTASQNYSNIAGIIAGFSFTAVILVIQMNTSFDTSPSMSSSKDMATTAFLLSFFGCILASVVFSLVAGEEELHPRANNMALLAGLGFSLSASLAFWGLSILIKISVSDMVANLLRQMFPIIVATHPAYVAFNAFDNIYTFDNRSPTAIEVLKVLIPSYLPFLIVFPIYWLRFNIDFTLDASMFYFVIWAILAFIVFINLGTTIISFRGEQRRLGLIFSGLLVGLHSCMICILILSN